GAPSKLRLGGPVGEYDHNRPDIPSVHTSQTRSSRGYMLTPFLAKRFHQSRQLHFLTFSCYHRRPKFETLASCAAFEFAREQARQKYSLCVYGYVVMPEHVHMLVNEPEHGTLVQAMQSLKQSVARRLTLRAREPFWQARYYDFNLWSERKFVEKLSYIPQ